MRSVSSAPMPASGSSSSSTRGAVARHIAISSWRLLRRGSASPAIAVARAGRGRRLERARARCACCRRIGAAAPARAAHGRWRARLRGEPAVLEHAERGKIVGALVAAAEAGARAARLRPARDVARRQADAAGGRRELAREQVDQRRLAGAVGADDRVHLAAVQRRARRASTAARPPKRRVSARSAVRAGRRRSVPCDPPSSAVARASAAPRSCAPQADQAACGSSATKAMIVRPSVSCQCSRERAEQRLGLEQLLQQRERERAEHRAAQACRCRRGSASAAPRPTRATPAARG